MVQSQRHSAQSPLGKGIAYILLIFIYSSLPVFSQNTTAIPKEIQKLENLTIYPADASPEFNIGMKKVTSYGDTKDVLLGPKILDVQVDDKGHVYMLDFVQEKVHVFNPDGSFLQSVGRQGRGPGEFQRPTAITIEEDHLYVLDNSQFKVSVFDVESLELIKDANIALKENHSKPSWKDWTREKKMFYKANNIIARGDGTLFVVYSDNTVGPTNNLAGRTYEFSIFDPQSVIYQRHDVLSFDWTGGVLKTVQGGSGFGMSVMFNVPYKRTSQFGYQNNQLIYGWTDHFLFKTYDQNGTYQRAFYYALEPANLKEEDVFRYYNNNQGITSNIQKDNLPKTWPAFNNLVIDDKNRLWVSSFTDNPERITWRVLNPSGTLIASYHWPEGYDLKQVQNGYAYVLKIDQETGLQTVDQYRFEIQ